MIAAENTNFGAEFYYAGDVVSRACGVRYVYHFELMGFDEAVRAYYIGYQRQGRAEQHLRWGG